MQMVQEFDSDPNTLVSDSTENLEQNKKWQVFSRSSKIIRRMFEVWLLNDEVDVIKYFSERCLSTGKV
jgi:hypothetical protein